MSHTGMCCRGLWTLFPSEKSNIHVNITLALFPQLWSSVYTSKSRQWTFGKVGEAKMLKMQGFIHITVCDLIDTISTLIKLFTYIHISINISHTMFHKACMTCLKQSSSEPINSSLPGQNGRLFTDDIFKCIYLNEKVRISIEIPMKFVSEVQLTISQHWLR